MKFILKIVKIFRVLLKYNQILYPNFSKKFLYGSCEPLPLGHVDSLKDHVNPIKGHVDTLKGHVDP